MFNEAHLLGLLLCRDWFAVCADEGGEVYKGATADLPGVPTELTLAEQQEIRHMTSKCLVRTIESLQAEWAKVMYRDATEEQWLAAERLVWALFWRTGFFAVHSSSSEELFNDPETTEVLPQGQLGYTHSTLRALMDIFVVLFRHLDLHRRCEEPRECTEEELLDVNLSVMRPHAIEATKDDFYKLSMHFDALVGARLAYQHRFQGMYNCISQVIYFHSEDYERRKHGSGLNEALDALPVLLHMFQQVLVVMEEERAPADATDYWMMVAGRVYLMRGGKTPLYHADVFRVFCSRSPLKGTTEPR
eukprot:346559-Rhodomonas_salina.3